MSSGGCRGPRRAQAVLLLAVALALPVSGALAGGSGEWTIHAKALDDHDCNPDRWELVITQADRDGPAPDHVHVNFTDGRRTNVSLANVTGGTAHYRTQAALDADVNAATANIHVGWEGQFNLGEGPCQGDGNHTSDEGTSDEDGDGIEDSEDNCPGTPNADQTDTDGDGTGDACESDRDGDGVEDDREEDGCTDPDDPDTDADGLEDGLELDFGLDPCDPDTDDDRLGDAPDLHGCSDPLDPDTDADELLDGRELLDLSIDPCDPDTDDGGFRDGDEVAAGTDPGDARDDVELTIEMQDRYGMRETVDGLAHVQRPDGTPLPNRTVVVDARRDAGDGVWDAVGPTSVEETQGFCATGEDGACPFELPAPVAHGVGAPALVTPGAPWLSPPGSGQDATGLDHPGRWIAQGDVLGALGGEDQETYVVTPREDVDLRPLAGVQGPPS